MYSKDTIAAIATPPGKGGIGIVRVSGDEVPDIIQQLFGQPLKVRSAKVFPFYDEHGEILDTGVTLYFKAPHSYTGEHVLELQGHGGPIVLNLVLKRILSMGARLAQPGEFTERAFLNDKIDLLQAEAVMDLIESSSEQAARAAQRSLEGSFSKSINELFEKLVRLRTYIEAALDFPEEEIDFLSDAEVSSRMQELQRQLLHVFNTVKQGRLLKEGMTAVLLGKPNVGKSSLLNSLAGKDTAIVTPIAGTTRDVLREHIHIEGIPLHIIDTAGLQVSNDLIEQEGVKRAWAELDSADIALIVVDDQVGMTESEQEILKKLPQNIHKMIIYNKIDLTNTTPYCRVENEQYHIGLSVKMDQGLNILSDTLKQLMGYNQTIENVFSARQRHIQALDTIKQHIDLAEQQLGIKSGELAAEELKIAQQALSSITGEFTSDDLLGEIFAGFCIGK